MQKKGQAGIIAIVIGLVIGVVLLIGVLVPITSETVDAQNFSGTNATIADNLTTFILIGALVLVAGIAYFGMSRK
jgi:predicted small integral membrane protein